LSRRWNAPCKRPRADAVAAHVVLVMHAPLGTAFAACARHVLGHVANLHVVDVAADAPPGAAAATLSEAWLRLPAQDELLVLCDIYGATPFNIAVQALRDVKAQGRAAHLITGTNLCMVLKALTEAAQHPKRFAERVRLGALRGIVDADGACASTSTAPTCSHHAQY